MSESRSIDIARVLDRQKIGLFYLGLLILLLMMMFFDGYNLQAISYAAPAIIKQWNLPKSAFGPIFGSGLFGLFVGAIAVSYVGDRWGRKSALIGGAAIFSICTLLTTRATNLPELMALRFLAGFGVGGVNPIVLALNAEYAPERFRATGVAIIFMGYTAGAATGGIVASSLLPSLGWPVIFWVGGLGPIAVILLQMLFLPESVRFLALSGGRPDKIAAILRRVDPSLAIGPDCRFILHEEQAGTREGLPAVHLFSEGRAPMTLLLWTATAGSLMTLNFLASWMPTVLHSAAITAGQAALATSLFHFSGSIGGLISSRLVDRLGVRVLGLTFSIAVAMVILVGTPSLSPFVLMLAVVGAGGFVIGSQIPLNAVSANIYPTFMRSTGAGWALAAGRIGSFLGPVVGGVLISLELSTSQLFWAAAMPVLCSAICCFFLSRVLSGQTVPQRVAKSLT